MKDALAQRIPCRRDSSGSSGTSRLNRGFTLIELLVVIAIIAILAAILFPVFARARAAARQSACLSNLKQVGTALYMYAQDYDETLPGNHNDNAGHNLARGFLDPADRRNWARETQPYIKNLQVLICPETSARSSVSFVGPNPPYHEVPSPPGGNTSYLMNGIINSVALAVIPAPADIIFLHEYAAYGRTAQVRPHKVNATSLQWHEFNHALYDRQHNEGANLLYCDGHAKWSKKTGIKYQAFGAAPNCPFYLEWAGTNRRCTAAF